MNCKNVKWGQKIKGIVKLMETPYENKISSLDDVCYENKARKTIVMTKIITCHETVI